MLTLLTGVRYSTTLVPRKAFGFGLQFYDPLDLIPFGSVGYVRELLQGFEAIQSPWLATVITIVLVIVLALLLLRWAATVWFFRKLSVEGKPLDHNSEQFISELCSKLKMVKPRIVSVNKKIGPMTFGVLKPTIILPKWILKTFKKKEVEVMIGHELAHVKRRDNLLQWPSLFFKDLLLYSPFSRWTYRTLQISREQAADILFLRALPEKTELLATTVKKVSEAQASQETGHFIAKAAFAEIDLVEKRLKFIEKNKKIAKQGKFNYAVAIFGLILFFWVKAWIVVKVGTKGLMLIS